MIQCSFCKITLDYIIEVGRLGCPKCYDTFGSLLRQSLAQMKSNHVGKRPKSAQIATLEDEMANAILEGRFEEVDELRNKIKNLKI